MNNFKALITLGLIYLSLFNFYWIVSNQTELRNNVQIVQEGKLITDLQEFHWEELLNNQNGSNLELALSQLIHILLPHLIQEPLQPINTSCFPPSPTNQTCPPRFLVGSSVPKIGVLIQLGFDVDSLEIHLNELYDIVDKFFILESTRTHFHTIRKPLIWERIRLQPRFEKFSDKIIPFTLDDAESAHLSSKEEFALETLQETLRWEKFLRWNNSTRFFNEDDFLGFGDVDEVPSRTAIQLLKHCNPTLDPVDIGIWFPFGNIENSYLSDFPVRGYPYTLGDPTYWRLKTALDFYKSGKIPTRMRGLSPSILLGGMHLTHYGYLPYQIVRRFTVSENRWDYVGNITAKILEFLRPSGGGDPDLIGLEKAFAAPPAELGSRLRNLTELLISNEPGMRQIAVLPWFYNCNRDRYPSWEGRHDTRLDI